MAQYLFIKEEKVNNKKRKGSLSGARFHHNKSIFFNCANIFDA